MPFYLSSSADYGRLKNSVARNDVLLLAKKSTLVGQGPDCWYNHDCLYWAPKPAEDAGEDQLHAVAFGRGPEPRAVETREVTVSEAVRVVNGKCSIDLERLPDDRPPLDFKGLHTYRCIARDGTFAAGPYSVAAFCDAALVNMMAELDASRV